MPKLLLGLTGSVASIKGVELAKGFREAGFTLRILLTSSVSYFLGKEAISALGKPGVDVFQDSDEWPETDYKRGQVIPHIALRDWCDLMVIAPLDAHTLAKTANGLADNLLTSVLRAWDFQKPLVLAPAMNTHMWYHPITARHLKEIASFFGISTEIPESGSPKAFGNPDNCLSLINDQNARLHLVSPIKKILACGEEGMGAMADSNSIIEATRTIVARFPPTDKAHG